MDIKTENRLRSFQVSQIAPDKWMLEIETDSGTVLCTTTRGMIENLKLGLDRKLETN